MERVLKNKVTFWIGTMNTIFISEKEKFFASKYLTDPVFIYPDIDFDKFNLHREFFSQPLEMIEDGKLRKLYEDIIYAYSGLIQCIETIGDGKKFYYNSLRSFGTPTEQDVENAKSNKVQGFIVKPYNKDKILGSIKKYLKATGKGV